MTLPVYPNAISMDDIRTEYGLSGSLSLSQLYKSDSGPVYTGSIGYPQGTATPMPTSGEISLDTFHGNANYVPESRTVTVTTAGSGSWTVPSTLISNITVLSIGGGGGGAGWPSQAGGGGGGGGSRWIGRPSAGTVIGYSVGAGGARGAGGAYGNAGGATTFGSSGEDWYISATGGGGGYGTGSSQYATGGTGNYGTGGNGSTRGGGTTSSATTLGGGGAGYDGSGAYGNGAGGGGRGGSSRTAGTAPGGAGGGGDGGTGGNGANGGIIISGVW